MITVIYGCGKDIKDENGNVIICCGDHIDIDTDEDGRSLVEPVLCDECWEIQKLKRSEGEKNENRKI